MHKFNALRCLFDCIYVEKQNASNSEMDHTPVFDVLCDNCQSIFDDDFNAIQSFRNGTTTSIPKESTTHSSLELLFESAKDGCHLCSLTKLVLLTDPELRRHYGPEQRHNPPEYSLDNVEIRTSVYRLRQYMDPEYPYAFSMPLKNFYVDARLELEAILHVKGRPPATISSGRSLEVHYLVIMTLAKRLVRV